MSKQALGYLLKEVRKAEDSITSIAGSSKAYRKEFIDKSRQIFELGTVSYIASELTKEINIAEPRLIQEGFLTQSDIQAAAETLRHTFLAKVKPDNIIDRTTGIVTYNTYDPMAKNLSAANKAAFEMLQKYAESRGTKIEKLNSNLTSPDHTRAVADIRFSHVFNNRLNDPAKALKMLRDHGNLSEDSYTAFLHSFLEITSYYTKGDKVFDVKIGAELKLRSAKDNVLGGSKLTKAITDEIRNAVNKAVINKNWVDQSGSDSYKEALIKELTNIAVKSGAKGKLSTPNRQRARVGDSKKIPIRIKKYKPKGVKKVEYGQPLISLQSLVNYINQKLPIAMRDNMGEPALVNRTGTLADSARVVNVQQTAQGYPSFGYTYQRSPYDVFDPVLGRYPWNTPGRDPKKLVEQSVRDVARELAIGRFYLRRV